MNRRVVINLDGFDTGRRKLYPFHEINSGRSIFLAFICLVKDAVTKDVFICLFGCVAPVPSRPSFLDLKGCLFQARIKELIDSPIKTMLYYLPYKINPI